MDTPPTPVSNSSGSISPEPALDDPGSQQQKKKKKKKSKKPKTKETDTAPTANATAKARAADEERPPVLCISRNKHWRYISSYHGPWLQLPLELLDGESPAAPPSPTSLFPNPRPRDRGFASLGDHSPPDSPQSTFASLPPPPPFPPPKPGKATPPPIDPGVFRSVANIRRLIDEASELSVRASSGLSAAALGSLRGGANNSPWASAHGLGINPLGDSGGGRNVAMSAMRIHRLRALAVQKLAAAYRTDEIASSVMVMQGGSVFDDIAERVLRVDPYDVDARYVHFFTKRYPPVTESTTTHLFFRTRGIDFTHVIKEARASRKAKMAHRNNLPSEKLRGKGHKKKGKAAGRRQRTSPPNGRVPAQGLGISTIEGPTGATAPAPVSIEPQCLFLRASAYLQHAVFLIEEAILKLENIRKAPTVDGAELRLCYVENGRYGGVEIGHPDGPLGKRDGAKAAAYRAVLAEECFREQITTLVRKSMRDHEKFLSHFDSLEGVPGHAMGGDLAARIEYAFRITESLRPGNHAPPPPVSEAPSTFTTYHPLLVESHFSILIGYLFLGDFPALLPAFTRTAAVVDGLEGYPVFLPPRSMAQAEYVEVLERLGGGWRNGVQSHSLSRANQKQLAIECAPSAKAKTVERVPTPPSPDASSSERLASSTSTLALGVNGSSSSSAVHMPPSPSPSGRNTPSGGAERVDLLEVLDAARILLSPVVKRQRERAEKAAADKAAGGKGKNKPLNINIPLHGPRVEIVLAWLGAVHLPELDAVA
ncbi:uncharacterized protein B0H18DRAFT_1166506 [Fomitopsis serialis]|uniref:uncharacterized protein n=1 Tax=Fomitopsis serialis TaxID=139415 RepID=UPI0020071F99|nr:uncharacterized protein B0H18DRAFT_1166506 [Neoantrodia serialis]KAH9926427.1 hypothetical protein B0H18DRAFT_1166506 [Neoantrodia serialis]